MIEIRITGDSPQALLDRLGELSEFIEKRQMALQRINDIEKANELGMSEEAFTDHIKELRERS